MPGYNDSPTRFDNRRGQLIRETHEGLEQGTEALSQVGERLAELKQTLLDEGSKCTCLKDLVEAVEQIEALHGEAKGHLERVEKVSGLLVQNISHHEAVADQIEQAGVLSQFENAQVKPTDRLTGEWRKLRTKGIWEQGERLGGCELLETYGRLVCYSKHEITYAGYTSITEVPLARLEKHLAEVGLHLRQD